MKQVVSDADRAIAKVLRQQAELITRSQVLAAGWTLATLRYRTRVGGPWTTVLPGVYMNHHGPLTLVQREIAAVLYSGPGCVITGQAALQRQGVLAPVTDIVDVLVPRSVRKQGASFVRLHRTSRLPERPWVSDGIRCAPVARAVADAARGAVELREVTALAAAAVQRGRCTVGQLGAELTAGPSRGSALLRAALEEVADGVRSAAEADLRKLVKVNKLPEPMYNARLYAGSEFLAQPDAWWPDAGVAGEADSREWHLSPADWARTMERHARMSAQGIIVLHFTPARIKSDGARTPGHSPDTP
jgi:hypothetical protein